MSEEPKNAEQKEQEVQPAELSDKDLEQVAGGVANTPGPFIIKGVGTPGTEGS